MSRDSPEPVLGPTASLQILGNTAIFRHHSHVRSTQATPLANNPHILFPVARIEWFLTVHIRLCIRDAKEAFSVRPRFPDQFHYMVLDVEDNEEQNLIRLFPG